MGSPRLVTALGVAVALLVFGVSVARSVLDRRGVDPRGLDRRGPFASYPSAPSSATIWPGPAAVLTIPTVTFPPSFGVRRVVIDPGHGAAHNTGNTSCFCVEEQTFTLAAAEALRDRLIATGHFDVKLSREADAVVEYQDRLDDAASFGAEAFVSLHSDIRGKAERWAPDAGQSCPISLVAPGFSVLYSDEGAPELAGQRSLLARAVARRMGEAGLLAYGGASYQGLYDAAPGAPGVFLDRHPREQRIFILRQAAMPSVLIETHHALDPREVARWEEPATLDTLASAVAGALVEVLDLPAR